MNYRPTGRNVLIERIAAQKEIAGMQVGASAAKARAERQSKDQIEGLRIGAEIARLNAQYPLDDCRDAAKKLLVETDWSQLGDVGLTNKAEFDTYRAAVRALVLNPVANPTFPAKPQGQWS